FFFFSSRRRHTRFSRDWSSDVCSSDLVDRGTRASVKGAPMEVPLITIDGPTASGKGTVAYRVAQALGWGYLDSGALYRLCALAALRGGVDLDDEPALAALAATLPVHFTVDRLQLVGHDVR